MESKRDDLLARFCDGEERQPWEATGRRVNERYEDRSLKNLKDLVIAKLSSAG